MSSWPARLGTRASARPSFAAVAEEHLDAVFRYLLLVTRDHATAQDLTSETFEKAFRSWRRFDPRRSSPRTWLCRIARNAALDHFRTEERRRRRETAYAGEAGPAEEHPADRQRRLPRVADAAEGVVRQLDVVRLPRSLERRARDQRVVREQERPVDVEEDEQHWSIFGQVVARCDAGAAGVVERA